MTSQAEYFRAGLFVIAVTALGAALALWLVASREDEATSDFVTYMSESVSGLSVLAPVKLNGVQVGIVNGIELDPDDPARVRVGLRIADTAPVTADTIAVLDTQGITGIAFVQLTGGTRESRPLVSPVAGIPAEIPSGPSLFVRMDESVSRLMSETTRVAEHLQIVSQSLDTALRPENIDAGSRILTNIETLTGDMVANSTDIAGTLQELRVLIGSLSTAAATLPSLGDGAESVLDSLDRTSRALAVSAEQFGALAVASQSGIEQVSSRIVPAMDRLMSEAQALVVRTHELVVAVEQRPSLVLFGNQPRPGPGE